jgi:clorobiocin biosynthesis protein CloN7
MRSETTPIAVRTIEVPGASLYYEVRGAGPVLMMIGMPADSTGFAEIASLLADDYTVVTYDPRGISRSTIQDPEEDASPDLVADDVHRLLSAVTDQPVYVFASSGGAVTGLALATRHPEQVRTLIAHEPPLVELLPDSAQLRAAIDDIYDTYRSDGPGAAFEKFLRITGFGTPASAGGPGHESPQPGPPSAQAIANGNRMLAHILRPTTRYRPDIPALQANPTRLVVAAGTASAGQLPYRAAAALANQLETSLIEFPGDHTGFVSKPDSFARTLRLTLTG